MRRQQIDNPQETDVKKQLIDFWNKVGAFSRICFIINTIAYAAQVTTSQDLKETAICLGPIQDAFQFYRMFTSEFTHGNPAHILMNMCGLLMFGIEVEQTYGTAFYFIIHFLLMVISTIMSISFYAIMVYAIPIQYRGGPENLYRCGVGYSNILFGIAMVFSFVGEPTQNFFGLCRIEKKYIPWFYMLAIYFTIPDSSFMGHFCGLLAGLMIKFCGLYVLFPKFEWIQSFDNQMGYKFTPFGYFEAKECIESDFDSYFWRVTFRRIQHYFNKVRAKIFGYEYIPPPPDPIICPDSVEMVERSFP